MNRKDNTVPPTPKCWIYELDGGWKIFAGKTNEDNDLLSIYFAKPNECWFHINGMPGSHVILRNILDETARPDKALLEQAAAAAAWHSKARNGGRCAVTMALAKDVTKPRGAKPGLVEVRNERSIKVKPGLPPQNQGE